MGATIWETDSQPRSNWPKRKGGTSNIFGDYEKIYKPPTTSKTSNYSRNIVPEDNPYYIENTYVPSNSTNKGTTFHGGDYGVDYGDIAARDDGSGGSGSSTTNGSLDLSGFEDVLQRRYVSLTPEEISSLTPDEQAAIWALVGGTAGDYANYTGIPIIRGYYDAEGNFVATEYVQEAEQLLELKNTDFPTFQEYLTNNELSWNDTSGVLGKIGGLADLLKNAGTVGSDQWNADQLAQLQYAAEQAGFGSAEEYEAWLTDYRTTGIADMEGLSMEQRNTYARAFEQQIAMTRQDTQKMIEAIGVGSTSRAFAAMDQATSQIVNLRVQHDQSIINADQAQRAMEYQALAQRAETLIGVHSEEKTFLQKQMYDNRMGALSAYATQLTGMIQANQQTLDMYTADMTAIKYNADVAYNAIMVSIGLDEHLSEMDAADWSADLAPYYAEMEFALMEAEKNGYTGELIASLIDAFVPG